MALLHEAKEKDPFTGAFDGVFGKFRTRDSHPLYYLLTLIPAVDLGVCVFR